MKNNGFDCVEMMHQGQAAVKKRLAGKTLEEKLDYWHRRTEDLRERQSKLRQERIQFQD